MEPEYKYDHWGHHLQPKLKSEVHRFLTYCEKRDLEFDRLTYTSDDRYELTCFTQDHKCLAGIAPTFEEAIDNLNINLQARIRSKIDALCEELKTLEDMEI